MIRRLTKKAAREILAANDSHAIILGELVEEHDTDKGAELVEKYAIGSGHDGIRAHYASPVRKAQEKSYGLLFAYTDEDGETHESRLDMKNTDAYQISAWGVEIIAVCQPWDN